MKFRYSLLVLALLFFLISCEDSTCPDVVMTAPSNLSLEQLDWGSIQLTWQDNTTQETNYQIVRRIGEGDWEVDYQVLAKNSTSFIDSNLIEMGNYTYRVFGYNDEESSGFTEATYYFSYDEVEAIYPANEETVLILPEETIEYQAYLVDALDALVERDYEVWFKLISAPDGTNINGVLFNNSDSVSVLSIAGVASIDITAGSEEGEILLKSYTYNSSGEEVAADLVAYVDNQYPEVTEIEILTTEQITLGANDTAAIHLNLLDEEGNIVQEEYEVYVELLGGPEGFNINNEVYEVGEYVTVPTVLGQTVFSIGSGEVSGAASIRIYTYNSIEEISVEMANILVVASAPAYCELYSGGINEGEDVGNGNWRIHLNVLITDMYGNPVQNGTTVFFSLPDNPEGAFLETPNVFVGNINDPIPGVAYNYLSYEGSHTNDVVTVKITVGDFEQEFEVLLPLQFGNLEAMAVPFHFEWTEDNNPEYVDIEVRIILRDTQNNPINGQVLIFSTNIGYALEPSPPDTGDAWTGLTGIGTEPPFVGENGVLTKYIRVYKFELPAPDPEPETVQLIVDIQAMGADVTTQVIAQLTRLFD